MQNDLLASISGLSDSQLLSQLKLLVARERGATAEIIAHLAELDTREAHVREGYRSLYIYCRDALGLSDWEAFNRIEVARTARRFPVILALLADGSVNLTTIKLLAAHLTEDNHRAVLDAARRKRKAEVEELVARLSPRPDVPASVRRIPRRPPGCAPVSADRGPVDGGQTANLCEGDTTSRPAHLEVDTASAPMVLPRSGAQSTVLESEPSRPARAAATPLSPDRYKYQVTIGGETLEKIRLAKDMLGHAIPSGDDAAVLDRAFTALLVNLAKDKFADVRNPRRVSCSPGASAPPATTPMNGSVSPTGAGPALPTSRVVMRKASSRAPSAAVKRAVWLRDLGRCAFVGAGGHRCNERRFVEFHHVDPHALGGEATVEGIQLRCRRHNDYEGRLYFGKRRRPRGRDGDVPDGGVGASGDPELVPELVHLSPRHSTP